jgi:hypothetical protein
MTKLQFAANIIIFPIVVLVLLFLAPMFLIADLCKWRTR